MKREYTVVCNGKTTVIGITDYYSLIAEVLKCINEELAKAPDEISVKIKIEEVEG